MVYHPVIARWTSIDPLTEKWHQVTGFCYGLNNPLIYKDVDGRGIIIAFTSGPTGGGKSVSPNSQDAGSTGRFVMDAQK